MCELCNLGKRTKWYYEDKEFIILECETCKMPMIVSKEHADDISSHSGAYVYGLVTGIFKRKFHFRKEQRKVKDHFHWHIIFDK